MKDQETGVGIIKCLMQGCEHLSLMPRTDINNSTHGPGINTCHLSTGEADIGKSLECAGQPGF